MNASQIEAIANADAHTSNAALPSTPGTERRSSMVQAITMALTPGTTCAHSGAPI